GATKAPFHASGRCPARVAYLPANASPAGSCGRGSIFPAWKFVGVREHPDGPVGFVLLILHGVGPVLIRIGDVEPCVQLIYLGAEADPLLQQAGIVESHPRRRWRIDEVRD